LSDLTTVGFGDDAQHRHYLECCRGDSTADVADDGGLTRGETKDVGGVDARINATDNHRLHRRHDLQVCGEATSSEDLVALGKSVNYGHEVVFLIN
jgi:hypothetical protein